MSAWRYRDDILRALPNALMVLDGATLRVCYANPAAERLIGSSGEALAGRALVDFCLPSEQKRVEQALRDLRTGQSLRLRETLRVSGDREVEAEIIVHVTLLEDEPSFLVDLRSLEIEREAKNLIQPAATRHEALLQGVANATNRLMQPGSYDRVVREALAIVGEASGTGSIAVYQAITASEAQDLSEREPEIVFVRQQRWARAPANAPHPEVFPEDLAVRRDGLDELYARLARYEVIYGTAETLPSLRASLFRRVAARSLMIAPIFIDVSLWGFIGLDDVRAARAWLPEEASALQTLAASIGAAKQREQIELKLRHEREVADTLREVGAVLTSTLELDEMLARLLDQARRIVPFDSANVMLVRDGVARIVHCTGHDTFGVALDEVRKVSFPLDDSAYIGPIVAQGAPLILPDVRECSRWRNTPGTAHIRCWLGMPFLVRGEVVGLFALDSTTPNFYTDEHIRMLMPFAQQAGIAYENVRLYEQQRAQAVELAARLEQLDALYAASQSILSSLDLDVILQRCAEQMNRLTRSTSTSICSFDPHTRSGVVQAIWPEPSAGDATVSCRPGDRVDFGSPMLEAAIDRHKVIRLSAAQARRAFPDRLPLSVKHELVVVPVFSQARPLGVAVLRDDPAHTFTSDDLQTCRVLASQAAIAFEQALLFSDIRELERIKSEMIRLASHDLRGPLTRLQAYHQLLTSQYETLSPEARLNYLRQGGETVAEMQQIVTNLLSLERIEEQHRLAQPIVWADVITRAVDLVRADLAESRCTLEVDCSQPLPNGRGDPIRLERALANLLSNAIKYTPAGGQIVVRGVYKDYGDQPCVAVEVEDTGIGIPLDQQDRLFEPFFRVEADADIPGLGLGLSVVKAAVAYHNGSVYVDSEPGQGSLFGFRIPV
ncbi:MAG: GAF domain-containing protein [Anaerolineae bacterium]|nr:GAF domain-containing protein [Anaerolineae bacterium]